MLNQAFYLKYRPSRVSELDNEEVAEKISAYLKKGSIPHAFLLVGFKGTGKTSSARLIAKAINCENNSFANESKKQGSPPSSLDKLGTTEGQAGGFEPCNKCSLCRSITLGNNPDVLEIDAASNTSVDDIRDLRDKVRLSPVMSRYKVYIIDEVHMISKSAFNALLKTLEEPPKKVIFILATTELEKVPETIVSRCVTISFKKADEKSTIKSLKRIVRGEKLKIKDDVLIEIAKSAGGSFRDAAKILEQTVSLSKGEITLEALKKVTGNQSEETVSKFIKNLIDGETKKSILTIENLNNKNIDLQNFLKTVLYELHEIFLFKIGVLSNIDTLEKELTGRVDSSKLNKIIELLEKSYVEMKRSDIPELPFEIAVYEISNINNQISRSQDSKEVISNFKAQNSKISINPLEIRKNPGMDMQDNNDIWKQLISKVNVESKQLAAIMRSCKLEKKSKNVYEITTVSKFHYDRLRDIKAIELINKCALEILGGNVKIKSILIEK